MYSQIFVVFSLDRHKVMLACWEAEPEDRPSFTKLVDIMGDFLEDNVKQVLYACTFSIMGSNNPCSAE